MSGGTMVLFRRGTMCSSDPSRRMIVSVEAIPLCRQTQIRTEGGTFGPFLLVRSIREE